MTARAAVRTAFIVVFTAYLVAFNGGDIFLPWHPFATFGFSADRTGLVTSASPEATRSGLHTGDRIDVKRMPPGDRERVGYFSGAPEGSIMRLPLRDGRTVTLTAHQYRRSFIDNASDIVAVIALIGYIVVAGVLVLLRPMPATWAFYVFSAFFCTSGTLAVTYVSGTALFWMWVSFFVEGALAPVAFAVFALRFPDRVPSGGWLWVERAAVFVAAPALTAVTFGQYAAFVFAGDSGSAIMTNAARALPVLLYAFGVVVLFGRYAAADENSRSRLQWVVAALAVAFLPMLALDFVENAMSIFPPVTAINLAQAWLLLAPIALAYTILKHRLFDIRLVVSRALVYGLLMSFTVGLLALVDWAFGRWLAESRFALVVELALAVGIGILLTTLHKRLEAFLNGVIFRAQTLALKALHRFALETDLIGDPQHLLRQTYEALRVRLENDFAGVYTGDGTSYALETPACGSLPQRFSESDFAVLRLRRWHEAFECDEPGHPLRGSLLLPMTARGQLVGFIVCGPKRDHTHYLPEEVETLELLAHRAGTAYVLLTGRTEPSLGVIGA
ncbi:MAG TPA: GAF domain-containing protein [Candidatus Baltobacteraceae bacterium]|nr:GAF domain-containing protein [Candidatus Baltobacteraceae bacterium]